MTKVYHTSMDRTIEVGRIIDSIIGDPDGPTVIFIGGIHGNESSGVFALFDVFKQLREKPIPFGGNIYGIAGNLPALEAGKRYFTEDLNRLWTSEYMNVLDERTFPKTHIEKREQVYIFRTLQEIMKSHQGPFYFMDMHSTSSESIPFLVVNDSLLNRKFTEQFPLPMILGIEEYLEGPILSYINELGYVSF
ncbi:succinylglutamate desuccinylase/aspartoacylase family protein, partial [Reichenbachiella sp.]